MGGDQGQKEVNCKCIGIDRAEYLPGILTMNVVPRFNRLNITAGEPVSST